MALPYGFKAKANRIALNYRARLGKDPEDPLDVRALSDLLKIPIIPLSSFVKSHPRQVQHLTRVDRDAFSAVLIPTSAKLRIIIVNDCHSPGRQNSSVAHELSHVILGHPPSYSFGRSALQNYDQGIEGEANILASHLLITNEAALRIVRMNFSSTAACQIYGVSNGMLQYRLNASGARKRMARAGFQRAR
ncbi:MAG: ImmA/IrrE family metallo-endopeptidase [Syntrophobacteraceae bacterium]